MATRRIRKVFVANRGEIAVRIIRACDSLGLQSVAAVSEADRDSLPASMATTAVCIGPASATLSYLRPETLVTAALGTGCDAIHPGYGFLAENAEFAALCAQAGLRFIGPGAEAIKLMGNKVAALRLASRAQVPRLPSCESLNSSSDVERLADGIGYPILLKAASGGGGRGMRLVRKKSDLSGAMNAAAAEAQSAFGDPTLYMEKFIERARHIEIQVLADSHGNVLHLGERDCSAQRRHQKIVEEAPAAFIDHAVRRVLEESAIRLASEVRYESAGTVEFVYDEETNEAYFLEMNTRIQVEHPVTEMVTGIDLVGEQIRIACGEPISFRQDEVRINGHAIECRINAEDADRNFVPSPGRIVAWNPPELERVRVDSHCYPGYVVPPYYDSLLAKLIVHGKNRKDAIGRMRKALESFDVKGVSTTVGFHRRLLDHPDFRAGKVTTRWIEEKFLAH